MVHTGGADGHGDYVGDVRSRRIGALNDAEVWKSDGKPPCAPARPSLIHARLCAIADGGRGVLPGRFASAARDDRNAPREKAKRFMVARQAATRRRWLGPNPSRAVRSVDPSARGRT